MKGPRLTIVFLRWNRCSPVQIPAPCSKPRQRRADLSPGRQAWGKSSALVSSSRDSGGTSREEDAAPLSRLRSCAASYPGLTAGAGF